MMCLPHHMDNALSVPGRITEDKSMPGEREENLSPPLFEDVSEEKKRNPRSLIIREEWVDLTGDPLTASVLEQLLYWCQRVPDFDLYIGEEKTNLPKDKSSRQYGWFYKANQELIEETMLRVTLVTFRRYLNFLISRGWIQTRINPKRKWDRRAQYRTNLRQLCTDFQKKGHTLPGFEAYGIFPHSDQTVDQEAPHEEANFINTKTKNHFLKERSR